MGKWRSDAVKMAGGERVSVEVVTIRERSSHLTIRVLLSMNVPEEGGVILLILIDFGGRPVARSFHSSVRFGFGFLNRLIELFGS